MNDPQNAKSYKRVRGHGGFIRSRNWRLVRLIAARANVRRDKTYGPDRVAGHYSGTRNRDGFLRRNTLSCHCLAVLVTELPYDWYLRSSTRVANDTGRAN